MTIPDTGRDDPLTLASFFSSWTTFFASSNVLPLAAALTVSLAFLISWIALAPSGVWLSCSLMPFTTRVLTSVSAMAGVDDAFAAFFDTLAPFIVAELTSTDGGRTGPVALLAAAAAASLLTSTDGGSTGPVVLATPACLATAAPVADAGTCLDVPADGAPASTGAKPCFTSIPGATGGAMFVCAMPPMSGFFVGSADVKPSLARKLVFAAVLPKYPALSAITKPVPNTATATTMPTNILRRFGSVFTRSFNSGCISFILWIWFNRRSTATAPRERCQLFEAHRASFSLAGLANRRGTRVVQFARSVPSLFTIFNATLPLPPIAPRPPSGPLFLFFFLHNVDRLLGGVQLGHPRAHVALQHAVVGQHVGAGVPFRRRRGEACGGGRCRGQLHDVQAGPGDAHGQHAQCVRIRRDVARPRPAGVCVCVFSFGKHGNS